MPAAARFITLEGGEGAGKTTLAKRLAAAIAATGVDVISIGALTHSVAALDLGLDVELTAG